MDALENEPISVESQSAEPQGSQPESAESHGADAPRAKVVYTHAPVRLATLHERLEAGWRVTLNGQDEVLEASSDVDPALLEDIAARSGRVLVETVVGQGTTIVGAVQTQRALTIDASGNVDAKVNAFRIVAGREVLLSTARSFVKIDRADIELYGEEVVTRARQVAKILGRLISLN